MFDSLLHTKLFIPPKPEGLLGRLELVQRLQAGITRKLTLIVAPAGFGKTTLVTSWLHSREFKHNVIWYSLEREDGHLQQFFRYLSAGLNSLSTTSLMLVQAVNADQAVPAKSFTRILIQDLLKIDKQIVLILDDFHLIQSPVIEESINYLLDHLPPNLHLVITSRTEPNLQIAKLHARREITEILSEELRFDTVESQLFLQRLGIELTPQQVEQLNQVNEGWAAGLQLASVAMQARKEVTEWDAFIDSFGGSNRYITDYLTNEVLRSQGAAVEAFLLQSSILERFNRKLCAALIPGMNVQRMLQQIEQANLFLIHLDNDREWYRYHHLFADLLRKRLKEKASDDEIRELHRRAVHWLSENDLIEEALQHARQLDEWEVVGEAVARLGTKQINSGLSHRTAGWLAQIPDQVIRDMPKLAVDKAWLLYTQFRVTEMVPYLETAEKEGADLAHVGETAIMRAFYHLMSGNPSASIELAESVIIRLGINYPAETGGLRLVLGNAYSALSQTNQSGAAFTQAVDEMARGENWVGYSAAVIFLIRHHLEAGRLQRAFEVSSRFMERFDNDPRLQHSGGMQAGVYHALLLYERREEDAWPEAITRVEEALALSRLTMPDPAVSIWMNLTLALITLANGKHTEADDLVADARAGLDAIEGEGVLIAYYELFVRYYLNRRRFAEVENLFAQFATLKLPDEHPSSRLNRLHQAELLLQKGASREELNEFRKTLQPIITYPIENALKMRGLAVAALIEDQLGNQDQALIAIEMALRLAGPQGWVSIFDFPGEQITNLVHTVRSRSTHQLFINKVLSLYGPKFHSKSAEALYPDSILIEPLSEREREVLQLVSEGLANKEIAKQLHLAIGTVKRHLNNINGKLQTASRTQAVARARAQNLL